MNRALFSLVVLAMFCRPNVSPAAGENLPRVSAGYSLEKKYGYFIGDVLRVSYRLALPPEFYLREDSIPDEGAPVKGVEVRGRTIRVEVTRERRNYDIELLYQLFFTAETASKFEIPALKFHYGPRENGSKESSAWTSVPITVSPLSSPGDQFQPPIMWSWRSTTSRFIKVTGALLLLSGLGAAALLSTRKLRRPSPFRKELKKLSTEKGARSALTLFRRALNEKAGRAIFPANLEDFLGAFPEARGCKEELMELMLLSDEASFNPEGFKPEDGLHAKIARTMKRMKRLEKWA